MGEAAVARNLKRRVPRAVLFNEEILTAWLVDGGLVDRPLAAAAALRLDTKLRERARVLGIAVDVDIPRGYRGRSSR